MPKPKSLRTHAQQIIKGTAVNNGNVYTWKGKRKKKVGLLLAVTIAASYIYSKTKKVIKRTPTCSAVKEITSYNMNNEKIPHGLKRRYTVRKTKHRTVRKTKHRTRRKLSTVTVRELSEVRDIWARFSDKIPGEHDGTSGENAKKKKKEKQNKKEKKNKKNKTTEEREKKTKNEQKLLRPGVHTVVQQHVQTRIYCCCTKIDYIHTRVLHMYLVNIQQNDLGDGLLVS